MTRPTASGEKGSCKGKFRFARKPSKCPFCGSGKVVGVVYGMPSHQLYLEELEGKVVLGGCCIGSDDPAWQCLECHCKFYKKKGAAGPAGL